MMKAEEGKGLKKNLAAAAKSLNTTLDLFVITDRKQRICGILCVMQLNGNKKFVYGAIALIWIVFPSLEILFSAVTTDIIEGTCIKFRAYPSYAAGKIVGFFNIFMDYLLPLPLLLFCYARIVHRLRSKVVF